MAKTRTCLGCEGSGTALACANCGATNDADVILTFGLCAPCADRESEGEEMDTRAFPCPVCDGSGQVPDDFTIYRSEHGTVVVGPRRDALADGETLRLFAYASSQRARRFTRGYSYPRASRVRTAFSAACGMSRRYWMGPVVVQAARAAFRAVPGLRGE